MTAERRLAAAATKLTPMERARLALRAHFAGETLNSELLKVLKPDEPECGRIMEAANEANAQFYQACSYIVGWLYQEEIQLGWLRCLDGMRHSRCYGVAGWWSSASAVARTWLSPSHPYAGQLAEFRSMPEERLSFGHGSR